MRKLALIWIVVSSLAAGGNATAEPTFVPLGPLLAATSSSSAVGVSGDGTRIVGLRDGEAYLYAESGGVTLLGDLLGGTTGSTPSAISENGQVVVGKSLGPWGEEALELPGFHGQFSAF